MDIRIVSNLSSNVCFGVFLVISFHFSAVAIFFVHLFQGFDDDSSQKISFLILFAFFYQMDVFDDKLFPFIFQMPTMCYYIILQY